MLELIKRNVISVNQDDLFADIEIRASDESDQEQSLVSEFGE